MNGSRSRTQWFVAMAFVAVWVSVLAAVSNPRSDVRMALALAVAAATADAAVAALAGARFRDSRDPHALFLSVAFIVLSLQQVLFGVAWPFSHVNEVFIGSVAVPSHLGVDFSTSVVPTYAWLAGWIVAGVLLILALPWWDRRGRPPVRAGRVLILSLGATLGADLLLSAFLRDTKVEGGIGILGWGLGVTAAALLLVAAWREWHTRRAAGPYLCVGLLLGVTLQVAVIVNPTPGSNTYQWADALALLIPALALAGSLLEQRTEASRMRRTSDRAQEVMGGRAEIASMIAHEVRGPVSTVRGIAATSLAYFDRLSDEERREFLALIEQESQRLMETVDQMSLALKIDAGTLAYQPKAMDLGEVVRGGSEMAEITGHTVDVDAPQGVSGLVDGRRMQEVVRQLVVNAARYSPEGSSIQVTLRREPPNGDGGPPHALIEVADAGPGIPQDLRERVFEKFPNWRPQGYQDQPGTGLGLFICRGIVTEHAGEIHAVDAPSGGTMLRVRIPVEG